MPLRRAGSLFGLLGLELAAVLGLHWLGRFPGLRVGWDDPVPWVLSSPVQEVLGALLRTVGLVMAYWLLASTVLYLLASLTRLPAAVRAVSWATLPLARRVADHAVAVTLATSMVGTTTLGVASPALAAGDRGRAGPPARKPVAAAQAAPVRALGAQDTTTSRGDGAEPGYVPKVEGGDSTDTGAEETTRPTTTAPAAPKPTETSSEPAYVPTLPKPTTTEPGASRRSTTSGSSTTTSGSTTTTTTNQPTTSKETTAPKRTTTSKPTTTGSTTSTSVAPTTTTTTAAPTTTRATTTTAAGARQGAEAAATTTTGLRPPAYEFTPAEDGRSGGSGGGGGGGGSGGSRGGGGGGGGNTGTERREEHPVARGDNLWAIARDHLSRLRSGGSGAPTNHEVAEYWHKLIEANRDRLRSGDPDLIYPGEEIILPPPE
jgi:uncharacterized membrane protein YgcG